jgi:hypothetical protein
MQPDHDAWLIQNNGKVRKIKVTRAHGAPLSSGEYFCAEWDITLVEGSPSWGFDRHDVYREAIRRAEQKEADLKRQFVDASNFVTALLQQHEDGE